MRTLTQGPYGVCYKESGLYMTRRVSSFDTTRRLEYMDYQDDPNRTFYDSNLCLFSKNMIFWWAGLYLRACLFHSEWRRYGTTLGSLR